MPAINISIYLNAEQYKEFEKDPKALRVLGKDKIIEEINKRMPSKKAE